MRLLRPARRWCSLVQNAMRAAGDGAPGTDPSRRRAHAGLCHRCGGSLRGSPGGVGRSGGSGRTSWWHTVTTRGLLREAVPLRSVRSLKDRKVLPRLGVCQIALPTDGTADPALAELLAAFSCPVWPICSLARRGSVWHGPLPWRWPRPQTCRLPRRTPHQASDGSACRSALRTTLSELPSLAAVAHIAKRATRTFAQQRSLGGGGRGGGFSDGGGRGCGRR